MLKLVMRVLLVAIVLLAVYLLGMLSASSGGLFNFLTGNNPPTVNVTTVLESIKSMSQLTTTRFTYSLVITSERDMPQLLAALYGDRQVMLAIGHVNAGIDLNQINQEDIQQVGDIFTVRLPAPALQDCFFNEQNSYVISRDTGLFARPLPSLDTHSRRYALQIFRDQALEDGILEEARVQSELAVQEFIDVLPGVEGVRVVTEAVDPDAPLPATCQ